MFESIHVEIEEVGDGVVINFMFVELKLITEVEFKGIGEMSETDLSTLITVKSGDPFRKKDIDITLMTFFCKPLSTSVNLSHEHSAFEWATFEKAMDKIDPVFHKDIDNLRKNFL